MRVSLLFKISLCVFSLAMVVFNYLENQNESVKLKMRVPKLEKQLMAIEEENSRLRYEIEQFESPANLMRLAKQCEFSHLVHPVSDDILIVSDHEKPYNHAPIDKKAFENFTIVVGAK